jgi:hypothetical protein
MSSPFQTHPGKSKDSLVQNGRSRYQLAMPDGDESHARGPCVNERRVRVFISSIFRDMRAERDHLVTVVFPELRERVEALGLEFFDVDLRWSVPAKTLNGETTNSGITS